MALGETGGRLDSEDRLLVQFGQVGRPDVGAGAAHPRRDVVEQILDAAAFGIQRHPGGGDALLEQRLAGPLETAVGGGAGGLELATRLGDRLGRNRRAEVTLIDCARTHIWKPLLHEVAAGSLDANLDEVGYLAYGDDAANVLYHVVNDRHIKRRAMLFTTNKHPKHWGAALHDDDLADERYKVLKPAGGLRANRTYKVRFDQQCATGSTQPPPVTAEIKTGEATPKPTKMGTLEIGEKKVEMRDVPNPEDGGACTVKKEVSRVHIVYKPAPEVLPFVPYLGFRATLDGFESGPLTYEAARPDGTYETDVFVECPTDERTVKAELLVRLAGASVNAPAVAADPVAHSQKARNGPTVQGLFEFGVQARNLAQKRRFVVTEGVFDFVGNRQLRESQQPCLPQLQNPGTQMRIVRRQLARCQGISGDGGSG